MSSSSSRKRNGKCFSQNTGTAYVSVSLSAPEFGTIYGNIANAQGDDPSKKVITWNPPSQTSKVGPTSGQGLFCLVMIGPVESHP